MTNESIKSPVGRLLNMYLFEKRTTDHENKTKPEDKQRFEAWVAFRKDDPAFNAYWVNAQAAAQAGFPHIPDLNVIEFSWKLKDGDGLTAKGEPYPQHCKGCWLISYTSLFPAPVFLPPRNPGGDHIQISKENNAVKAGDYVEIYGSFKGNGSQSRPGIYANLNMVRVVGFGEAIVSGPSASTAFGAAPVALPPGASATPVAPVTPLATPAPNVAPGLVPAPNVAPGLVPAPNVAPGLVPAPNVAPNAAPVAVPGLVPAPNVAPNAAPVAVPGMGAPNMTVTPAIASPTNAPPYTGYMVPGQLQQ